MKQKWYFSIYVWILTDDNISPREKKITISIQRTSKQIWKYNLHKNSKALLEWEKWYSKYITKPPKHINNMQETTWYTMNATKVDIKMPMPKHKDAEIIILLITIHRTIWNTNKQQCI